jgi:hypothetical protein
MVNFQIASALADLWRGSHKNLITTLSDYYRGVYSGDRLKNWSKIFVLSIIILSLWERIQFDSHFHMEVRENLQMKVA